MCELAHNTVICVYTDVAHARCRPLNSHGFILCHTVSLPFLQSHGSFFISHGFTNFRWIFSQTHNFLRKQTWIHNPLSKNIMTMSSTYNKINNFVIFHSEISTSCCRGNGCPVNYQKLYGKHRRDSFHNWNFFRTVVKNVSVGVLLLKKQTI